MQLHVVQAGESLYGIAQAYSTSPQSIATANQLDAPNELVVGQTLVIPIYGRYYFVQPGDTLSVIAARYGFSVQQLAEINNLMPTQVLPVGFRLYLPPAAKQEIETNAYIEPTQDTISEALLTSAREAAPYLTYLAPFSYRITAEGALLPVPLGSLPDIADENNTALMMVITNLQEGAFSGELGQTVLESPDIQNTLLDAIITEANRVGRFSDVHFDFEFLPPAMREPYNAFLRKAVDRLHQEGLLVSTALAPKTSAAQTGQWYEAHDYRAHGDIVDFVVLMTYEWGYSGGPPQAVSPIGPVTEVVEYALTEMAPDKIMLGQNLYGYDWTLPFEPGGEYARAISPQQAIALAREHNVAIEFDTDAQAPFFHYIDANGREHEVWFEDGRSIQAKFNLIKQHELRGISYWKLGLSFPQNWLLLNDQFTIRKRR
ncbi:glycoside hydrolase family 18 protein [Shouchella clausii]|uniref:glycoside hydrolase family 18 protein n=1 Tax=Shouchella clausii TaxID=79880 RepID=UPI00280A4EBE|nr:glycoside hydrolase family 18 protein [Shouchella clausii]WMM30875.1 glycoside hydrolase family 18 protein [Shouchella clausii]